MFLFWHSLIFQLPLTQLTTAYFLTDSNTCMASLVLHSPGFLLIWQIEHNQSSSMTTSHKSQAFPMVCHRVLCWAQFSSSSTHDLFLTWFSVTRLSLNLSRTKLSSKSLSLHRIFNLQYLLWKPVCQTSRPGCWKTNLKLNNDTTEALLLRSSFKSFSVGKPTTISVCGCEISFSSSARNLGFYIRDDMSVELHMKNVCWSAYSELCRISTIRHLLSADDKNTCARLCPL